MQLLRDFHFPFGNVSSFPLEGFPFWKINGWDLQPSPKKRKENELPKLHDYPLEV